MRWTLLPVIMTGALALYPIILSPNWVAVAFNGVILAGAIAAFTYRHYPGFAAVGTALLIEYGVFLLTGVTKALSFTALFGGIGVFLIFELGYLLCLVPKDLPNLENPAAGDAEPQDNSKDRHSAMGKMLGSTMYRTLGIGLAALLFVALRRFLSGPSILPTAFYFVLLVVASLGLGAGILWLFFRTLKSEN